MGGRTNVTENASSQQSKSLLQNPTTSNRRALTARKTTRPFLTAFLLLLFTAWLSRTIALGLSPVFGSIPALQHHTVSEYTISVLSGTVTAVELLTKPTMNIAATCQVLALLVSSTPLLQSFMIARITPYLGVELAPLAFEMATARPIQFLATRAAAVLLVSSVSKQRASGIDVIANPRDYFCKLSIALLPCVLYHVVEMATGRFVALVARDFGAFYMLVANSIVPRSRLTSVLAIGYVAILKKWLSKPILFAIVILWLASLYECGVPLLRPRTELVNSRLKPHGFAVLDWKESVTGYISVVENSKDGLRLLRNDHSLLGGLWLPDDGRSSSGIDVPESVYPVFHMLEAVRLMEGDGVNSPSTQETESALVIGLGIGTAPSALAAHGVNTSVVEIDTAVIEFAVRYFGLHDGVTNINEDAMVYASRAISENARFDYVVHDVFTGGAEPIELFTAEFLSQLRSLLKEDGRIVINYAGDVNGMATAAVLKTILKIFQRCRMYRDNLPVEQTGADLANMVIFCMAKNEPWSFRAPVDADFLQSRSRHQSLLPQLEVDISQLIGKIEITDVLSHSNLLKLRWNHTRSAIAHWKVMRSVLPAAVWETW